MSLFKKGLVWFCFLFLGFILPSSALARSQALDSLKLRIATIYQTVPDGNRELIPLYMELLPLQLKEYSPDSDSVGRAALRLAEYLNHDSLKLQVFYTLGAYSASVGNYAEAIELGERGFALAQQLNQPFRSPASYLNVIGLAYAHLEEYDKSVEYYLKIIEITEANHKVDEIGMLHAQTARLNVGTMFIRQDELNKALQYYEAALSGANQTLKYFPDDRQIQKIRGSLLGSIGRVYFKQAEKANAPDSLLGLAEEYYEASVYIFQEIDEKNNLAVGYHFLGDLYAQQDRIELAENYFLKAIEIRNQYKLFTTELIRAYTDLAKLYQKQKAYDNALSYLNPAIELGSQLETKQMLAEAYRLKSSVLKAKGAYDEAYEALLNYTSSNQAYMEEQKLEKMKGLEVKFALAQEKELRAKQEAIAEKVRFKRTAIFIICIFVLSAFLYLTYLDQSRLKAKNKLIKLEGEKLQLELQDNKREIEFKNKELGSMASRLMDRSNLIEDLKEELKIFEKEAGVPLKALWRKLNIQASAQEDIDRFQVILDEASTDFFYRLGSRFPDLSESEKRLAAMISIGWSSADIAKLENSSSSAIRTRKSRLKKKLQLNGSTSLEDFLSTFKT